MQTKPMRSTNILVHLAVWTLGVPLVFALVGGGLFQAIGAQADERNAAIALSVVAGLIVGFPLSFLSFFVLRGLRGWGEFFSMRREQRRDDAIVDFLVEKGLRGEYDQPRAQPDPDDPWNGNNPYGCCQDNYDVTGTLNHGSPDCKHPLFVAQRQGEL